MCGNRRIFPSHTFINEDLGREVCKKKTVKMENLMVVVYSGHYYCCHEC